MPTCLRYCYASKLPFLFKILEKIVYAQLVNFLEAHNIIIIQSGLKPLNSTEPALQRVLNYILLTTADPIVLVLLDFIAAFNTVDHKILISRLQKWVGIQCTALEWLRSFLTVRF